MNSEPNTQSNPPSDIRWLFAVKIMDKPGVLTAVASVFSHRGVSLRMIVGSTLASLEEGRSTLLVSFEASPAKMRMLRRTVERLAKVINVQSYRYDSIYLRAVASVQIPRSVALQLLPEEEVELVRVASFDQYERLLVIGAPPAIDRFLSRLRHDNHLYEATLLVLPMGVEE
jgi:acetolactate synthase small subunit